SPRAEQIDDALGERPFRSYHREMDALGERKLRELADLRNRNVLQTVLSRRTRVPRRDEDFLHAGALRQAPCDRVFPASRADDQELHQCRKCRMPVNTMAMPCSSAAAMTSSSRTLPPGWTTAVAPARAITSIPSRNGKNASDATTDAASDRPDS